MKVLRPSLSIALLALSALVVTVSFLHRAPAPATADLSAVAEADRWKFTGEGRAKHLADMRAREAQAAASFAWLDEKKGVVRLPLALAEEITIKEIAASCR